MLSLQGSFANNYDRRHPTSPSAAYEQQTIPSPSRKRKADALENERLSKRLGRLNIGQNIRRLYATVEDDTSTNQAQTFPPATNATTSTFGPGTGASSSQLSSASLADDDDYMQMDDTKHKVYIYNLDDELSSSESEAEDGKLIFLPDIEKALKANRIPPILRANPEGQLAGHNIDDMQLVLYNVPSSLTVAPEHDSVRKAIIEARRRMREKQRRESEDRESSAASSPAVTPPVLSEDEDAMDLS